MIGGLLVHRSARPLILDGREWHGAGGEGAIGHMVIKLGASGARAGAKLHGGVRGPARMEDEGPAIATRRARRPTLFKLMHEATGATRL